ncbi:cytochrome c oxidase assembly protein [Streptomyces sp. NPDC085929]|uniref:cytochrome c oxidase assembly protein n=1 Tax=Streptomyces sp. NPDC085929 TaxID=3365739 RepID=UPI0037CD91C5
MGPAAAAAPASVVGGLALRHGSSPCAWGGPQKRLGRAKVPTVAHEKIPLPQLLKGSAGWERPRVRHAGAFWPSSAPDRWAGWCVPPLAALLDLRGLWLLYRTELFAAVQHDPWLHALVHTAVLSAGLLSPSRPVSPTPCATTGASGSAGRPCRLPARRSRGWPRPCNPQGRRVGR